MPLSRSLLAIFTLGSLLSLPVQAAEVNYKLLGAAAFGALVTFLQARKINDKKDVLSTALNAGSTATQSTVNFVENNAKAAFTGLVVATAAYHNTNILNNNALQAALNLLKAAPKVS